MAVTLTSGQIGYHKHGEGPLLPPLGLSKQRRCISADAIMQDIIDLDTCVGHWLKRPRCLPAAE